MCVTYCKLWLVEISLVGYVQVVPSYVIDSTSQLRGMTVRKYHSLHSSLSSHTRIQIVEKTF